MFDYQKVALYKCYPVALVLKVSRSKSYPMKFVSWVYSQPELRYSRFTGGPWRSNITTLVLSGFQQMRPHLDLLKNSSCISFVRQLLLLAGANRAGHETNLALILSKDTQRLMTVFNTVYIYKPQTMLMRVSHAHAWHVNSVVRVVQS